MEYVSSSGETKNTATMNYEHLVNAFAKASREIFNAQNIEQFNKLMTNMQVLEKEIYTRIEDFLKTKIDDDTWLWTTTIGK